MIKLPVDNNVSPHVPKLDPKSLRVVRFSDASFAGNQGFTSQLGYLVFLSEKSDNIAPVILKSDKARRVTRSVLGAELFAFRDMFNGAYTPDEELSYLLPESALPVHLFTDSKNLVELISMGTRTSEKRFMLEIA